MVLDTDTFKIIDRSAIGPRTLQNPNERLVEAGREEDHQPHSKTLKHLTCSTDVDESTQPDIYPLEKME